jgi:hypothetical protein
LQDKSKGADLKLTHILLESNYDVSTFLELTPVRDFEGRGLTSDIIWNCLRGDDK